MICILGNLNIDLIIRGVPHLPEWGQEVFGQGRAQFSSGQAGYLALALLKLGVPVSLVGNLGKDQYGDQIRADLLAAGADLAGVEISSNPTGLTIAIVRPDGERAFVSDYGSLADFTPDLVDRHWNLVEAARIVCLVGTFCLPNLPLPQAGAIFRSVRAIGKQSVLDTGWDPGGWMPETQTGLRRLLKDTSLFLPNLDEARAITGIDQPEPAARVLQMLGPAELVVKCGARGSQGLSADQAYWLPARPVIALDAVGAGDVFNAGFLAARLQGWDFPTCQAFGSASASLYISRPADRFPTFQQTLAAAQDYPLFNPLQEPHP